jgi:hypothetical protein
MDRVVFGTAAGSVRLRKYRPSFAATQNSFISSFSLRDPVEVSLEAGSFCVQRLQAESSAVDTKICEIKYGEISRVDVHSDGSLHIVARDGAEVVVDVHLSWKLTALYKTLVLRCRGVLPHDGDNVTFHFETAEASKKVQQEESLKRVPEVTPPMTSIVQPLIHDPEQLEAPLKPPLPLDAVGKLGKGASCASAPNNRAAASGTLLSREERREKLRLQLDELKRRHREAQASSIVSQRLSDF